MAVCILDIERFRDGVLVAFSDDSVRFYSNEMLRSIPISFEESVMIADVTKSDWDDEL